MRERRNYLLVLGAIAALLDRRRIARRSRLAGVQEADARPRPAGRPRGRPPRGSSEGREHRPAQMQVAQQVITQRVNKSGVASPNIAIQGAERDRHPARRRPRPGQGREDHRHRPASCRCSTSRTISLAPTVRGTSSRRRCPSLYCLLKAVQTKANKGSPQAYYLFKTVKENDHDEGQGQEGRRETQTSHPVLQGPAGSREQLLLPYKNGAAAAGHAGARRCPPTPEAVSGARSRPPAARAGSNGRSKSGEYWYLFKLPPALTGKDLVESGIAAEVRPERPAADRDAPVHGPRLERVQADHRGRVQPWPGQRGPGRPAERGRPEHDRHVRRHNAIVLDGQLQETPYIDYTDSTLSQGIAGNAASDHGARCGRGQVDRARPPERFASVHVHAAPQTEVSATLGKSSLHQALWAAAIGLLVVAIFLLILYRFLGLVAVVRPRDLRGPLLRRDPALQRDADAAGLRGPDPHDRRRGRRERRRVRTHQGRGAGRSKSVRAAIAAGYGKGFHTILDANVVTVITAMVVFLIAVADVKGFALMLLIGTVISLLTAVVATRAMLGLLSGFRWFDNPRFMGAEGQQTAKWLQIDFMGNRNLWFAISGADHRRRRRSRSPRGPQPRHRFQGRDAAHLQDDQAVLARARSQRFMASQGEPDAVVQGEGKSRQRRLQGVAGPHEDRCRGRSRTSCQATLKSRPRRVRRVGRRASPERSATRSRSTRSTGSSSRCS